VLSVPFENLTKILKADGPGPASRKLRLPEELFKGFLERRSGGTCFARTFAYRALLRAIGYESSLHLGGVRGPGDHACTLVNVDGARVLSDVGFPLLGTAQLGPGPVVVRFPAYDFRVEPDRRRGRGKVGGLRSRSAPAAGVDPPAFLVTRIGPDGESPFFAFEAQPASLEAFERCWQRTFRKGAPFLGAVTAVRHEPDRIVRLQGREIVYRTRRGETRLPLRGEIPRKLSRVFGFSPDLVAEALLRRPL
jgi:arylamine N-acetyltransferase